MKLSKAQLRLIDGATSDIKWAIIEGLCENKGYRWDDLIRARIILLLLVLWKGKR